ncbi:MAG: hypothetical protein KR126chlam6_00583 [Candidatus Anoxychlamydiales bacterium]|nr:hypothetical protein [Candidatus Anoxychlamydiales bacterium]
MSTPASLNYIDDLFSKFSVVKQRRPSIRGLKPQASGIICQITSIVMVACSILIRYNLYGNAIPAICLTLTISASILSLATLVSSIREIVKNQLSSSSRIDLLISDLRNYSIKSRKFIRDYFTSK